MSVFLSNIDSCLNILLVFFATLTARGFTVRVVVSVWLAIKRTEACVSPVYLVPLESTKQHLERENVKSVIKGYDVTYRVSKKDDGEKKLKKY